MINLWSNYQIITAPDSLNGEISIGTPSLSVTVNLYIYIIAANAMV